MRLRVLSLNAWALPPPVGQRVHERLSLVLRALPALECDIALFQEIWTDEARAQVIEGGRSLGYRHTWTNPGPRGAAAGCWASRVGRSAARASGASRCAGCLNA
ncbi:MAG: hypothetical protein VCC20_08215 [Myxococcota bacterium]